MRAEWGNVVAGVDVGGTFTDLILIDTGKGGRVTVAKTPTTPDNQSGGVLAALAQSGFPIEQIDLIVHGTTTTTNAVLERRLARTGMITTRGFRDVIELGRRTRPQPYGMTGRFVPVIPRDLRLEVDERMEASGRVRTALDEDGMRAAVRELLEAGCESLVIHFLHAYANPAHELRAAEIAREIWPNDHITMGHALLSEAREFERGVTAAVNASVQPILERYVGGWPTNSTRKGYRRDFLMMNGNGGMISARFVTREAAKTVMSGPASGVMAAAYTAERAGMPNVITYDMGGTSTDVALIRSARPAVSNEIEIEYAMPIHVPMVDVQTVGAGGGSIARLDDAGLIRVGPESAGARTGADLLWARRHRADDHRRQSGARTAQPEPAAGGRQPDPGRGCARRLRGTHRQADRHGRHAGGGRRAEARQHEDGRRRSAWCRSPRATIRAISRCSPSGAPGRCTPPRWRANSRSRRCWCRRGRASPMRSAAWWPTSATISCAPSTGR
jgi:N-methylhydantoinase A/oxoprolinase/acetone carboxylase beta subunit